MYCDFCGSKLPYNVRYCRSCGRQLRDRSGDTQPLPVIDEEILCSTQGRAIGLTPWYKRIFRKKAPSHRSRAWKVLYYLFSLASLVILLYILATFQTIKEYQTLTAIWGGLLVIFIWWKR